MEDEVYDRLFTSLSMIEKINKERLLVKEGKEIKEKNILFVKTSSDDTLNNFVELLIDGNIQDENSQLTAHKSKNIGIRKIIKYLEKDTSITKLNLFDYNYFLSKKFKFLKNQGISFCDNFIFVVNIFDKVFIGNEIRGVWKIINYYTRKLKNSRKIPKSIFI